MSSSQMLWGELFPGTFLRQEREPTQAAGNAEMGTWDDAGGWRPDCPPNPHKLICPLPENTFGVHMLHAVVKM